MKKINKLPGALRRLFGVLRILTVILAAFWLLALTLNTWLQQRLGHDARLMANVGEIALPGATGLVGLSSDTGAAGSLQLQSLHGTLLVDLSRSDSALLSALLWSIIPSMAVLIAFSYVLFSALRNVCANLERGEVFHEQNLRLVRRIGASLIAYSLIGAGLEIWASHVLGGYFGRHVVLTGLKTSLAFPVGSGVMDFFSNAAGLFTTPGALLVGCLVLVVAEAFRQGLNLKTENDLTI